MSRALRIASPEWTWWLGSAPSIAEELSRSSPVDIWLTRDTMLSLGLLEGKRLDGSWRAKYGHSYPWNLKQTRRNLSVTPPTLLLLLV